MKKSFTLIELLVVVVIIAVLVALLLPSLGQARRWAQTLGCLSNLRTFGNSLELYIQDWKRYPEDTGELGKPRWIRPLSNYVVNRNAYNCPADTTHVIDYGWNPYIGGPLSWGADSIILSPEKATYPDATVVIADSQNVYILLPWSYAEPYDYKIDFYRHPGLKASFLFVDSHAELYSKDDYKLNSKFHFTR